ncbi:MAG: hypothetical protein K6G20_03650, partial [Ruminococcus sp.]|nr:hypothetical protein [Ruminococcus sp.]
EFINYDELITKVFHENVRQYNPNLLIEKLQLNEIVKEIANLHPRTIFKLRTILSVISGSQLSNYTVDTIIEFKNLIKIILQEDNNSLDRIQILQLGYTCSSIDELFEKKS